MNLRRYLSLLLIMAVASPAFQYNPEPTGGIRLVWKLIKLNRDIEEAREAAARRGVTKEDHYAGYALSVDPDLRKMQMRLRYAALEYEDLILRVVANSRDAEQRAIAATALGYTRQSQRQVDALVRATSDADRSVRSNAMRSLRFLLAAKPKLRSRVPENISLD